MNRNRTLDGVRGLLALVVLAHHVAPANFVLHHSANFAVFGFFVLSGMVLTKGWDGDYPRFLVRRFIRLWPLYTLTLAAGFVLAGQDPIWSQFLWWPLITPNDAVAINPPAWSLCIEAFAMLAFPLFVFCRGWAAIVVAAAFMALGEIVPALGFGAFFAIGAALSHMAPRNRLLESAIPQYLGKISYPLYLSHWLVLTYTPGPLWAKLVLAFAVAHVLTVTVERWSISGSRQARATSGKPYLSM